jgi:hypothetical protein
MNSLDIINRDIKLCKNLLSSFTYNPRKYKYILSTNEILYIRDVMYRKLKTLEQTRKDAENEEIGEFVRNGILNLFEPTKER